MRTDIENDVLIATPFDTDTVEAELRVATSSRGKVRDQKKIVDFDLEYPSAMTQDRIEQVNRNIREKTQILELPDFPESERIVIEKAPPGYYYAKDGTVLGRIGEKTDPTDVMLVEGITPSEAEKLIGKINEGWFLNNEELIRVSSAVGMTYKELNTRAFMSTLKQAENGGGTYLPYNTWNGVNKNGPILFTKESYDNAPQKYETHPGMRKKTDGTDIGSAAGAYQIMYDSWTDKDVGAKKYGVDDFSPLSQDKFIYLTIKYKLKAADVVANGKIEEAVKKTATEWRALPGEKTQSNITIEKIKELFRQNVSNELLGITDIATPKGQLTKYEKKSK